MATSANPSSTPAKVTEPAREPETTTSPLPDTRKLVRVRDTKTGEIMSRPVPETWLDGRFPNLKAVPSTQKAGK